MPQAGESLNLAGSLAYDRVVIEIGIVGFKIRLSRCLDSIGKGATVIICRRDTPIAEIPPVSGPLTELHPVGIDRGMTIPSCFLRAVPR